MTQEIETLLSRIENQHSHSPKQIELVLKADKDFRGQLGESLKILEQRISEFPQLDSKLKHTASELIRDKVKDADIENLDQVNDLFEAYTVLSIKYLKKQSKQNLNGIFGINRYLVNKPLSKLREGLIFYRIFSDILLNKRFTRYKLTKKQENRLNRDFNSLKDRIDTILPDYQILEKYHFELLKYIDLLKNENASYSHYITAIDSINFIKKITRDMCGDMNKEEIIRDLGFKIYFRSLVFNLILYRDLILKLENKQIKLDPRYKQNKKDVLSSLKTNSLKDYNIYQSWILDINKKDVKKLQILDKDTNNYYIKLKKNI